MPEISLLEPRVLNGFVSHFLEDISAELKGLSIIGPGVSDLNPVWEYDIIRGNRDRSVPNSPNAEANKIDHIKSGRLTGSYIYLRDKKMFEPTTLRWLREPGQNAVAVGNAEALVARELRDMDNRQKRYMEWCVWQMFKGSLAYAHIGGATITLDYGISAAHKPTVATSWGADSDDPIGDIQAWKMLTTHDAGMPITTAYLNGSTMTKFIKLAEVRSQLSDQQKQKITAEGVLPRFLSIDWVEYDGGYVESSTYYPYIPDDYIVFLAPGNGAWGMKLGPSADDDAPAGTTGTFSKTWKEPDPSNRQVLLEKIFIPTLFRPDQVVYAKITA